MPLPSVDRNLLRALAASLAVHGIALAPGPEPAGSGGSPLRATLRQGTGTAGSPSTGATSPDIPATEEPREPQERSYSHAEAAIGADTASGAGSAAPWGAADGSPQASPELATGQVPTPGRDILGKREYHLALSRMATRFRRFPQEAKEGGWEGRVVLRLFVSEDGRPLRLRLLGSSGHPELDRAALETMELAAGHTPVPELLLGRAFEIDLVVIYDPEDGQ